MKCIELKTQIEIFVNSYEELINEMEYFKNCNEFKEKFGTPEFIIDGLPEEDFFKQLNINKKYNSCKNYIYKYYPQEKQASDIADKVYYETLLRAKGINNLEQDIVNRTTRFYNGETIEEIIADVDDEDKVAYEQLLKVAIRTKFVQDCKAELKKAIDENKEIEYPKYPL